MKKIFLVFILLYISIIVYSKPNIDYNINKIHPELIDASLAVVRIDKSIFSIESKSKASFTVKKAISILEEDGAKFANIAISYDRLIKLKNLKINIYNNSGVLIKKVKSSEISDFSSYDGYSLYSDNRLKTYSPNIKKYPYTIEYEYELDFDGLFSYPNWIPIPDYQIAVENSEFSIMADKDFNYKTRSYRLKKEPDILIRKDKIIKKWSISNLKSRSYERYSPAFSEMVPVLKLAPMEFSIEGYEGKMNNWEAMGAWIAKLIKGRDELPKKTVLELNKLTANISDLREKIELVYKYVQNKTRYVSIQVGIGGWQAVDARTVDKLGYGDCKALSNYTMACLKAVGVKSYYSLIMASVKEKTLDKDFACNQFNHAILCVPVHKDTIWLECTSQTRPFGMMSLSTEDSDVLIIKDAKGEIGHTKNLEAQDNLQEEKLNIKIDSQGNANIELCSKKYGLQYLDAVHLCKKSQKEQIDYVQKTMNVNAMKISKINLRERKKIKPVVELNLNVSVRKFAKINSEFMLIPMNKFNQSNYRPSNRRERVNDIYVNYAYLDIDTILIEIPKNYKIYSLPEICKLESSFGSYTLSAKNKDGKICLVRKYRRSKIREQLSKYQDFLNFYRTVWKKDKENIVLVKRENRS
ncbi:MAG: DUF3857 domain-containing transglutaminase family protein [Marinifilaceae bacterium]|jgi:transglutaminase-like putative cysteine protease|nr:DUF3857 domain-containing transglutaminase family protein [Marinifilaceae bacterium]